MTPLHEAAEKGKTDVTKVLIETGASLSAVDNMVIKPSVKLIQSNIKLFIVLGQDTSTPGSMEWKQRCDKGSNGGRGLTVCCGQYGN